MLLLALGPQAAAQTAIGTASGVENTVVGNHSGEQQRIVVGNDVYQNETVDTKQSSYAHLIFVDKTNLSIGPDSNVVLDKFVYDPNGGAGKVVLQIGKGSFRFITGTQKKSSYEIKTPVATIGVRGTVFSLLNSNECSLIVLEEGSITLTFKDGKTIVLDKRGWGVQACSDGRVTGPQLWAVKLPDPFNVDHPDNSGFPPVAEIPGQNSGPGNTPETDHLPSCNNPSCN